MGSSTRWFSARTGYRFPFPERCLNDGLKTKKARQTAECLTGAGFQKRLDAFYQEINLTLYRAPHTQTEKIVFEQHAHAVISIWRNRQYIVNRPIQAGALILGQQGYNQTVTWADFRGFMQAKHAD